MLIFGAQELFLACWPALNSWAILGVTDSYSPNTVSSTFCSVQTRWDHCWVPGTVLNPSLVWLPSMSKAQAAVLELLVVMGTRCFPTMAAHPCYPNTCLCSWVLHAKSWRMSQNVLIAWESPESVCNVCFARPVTMCGPLAQQWTARCNVLQSSWKCLFPSPSSIWPFISCWGIQRI